MALSLLAACSEPSNENVSPEGPAATATTERETTTSEVTGPVEVARYSGGEETDTPNFTVEDSWELHWRIDPGLNVGIVWTDPPDKYPSSTMVLDQTEGSSLIREGGEFYLSITPFGDGSWEVWVVDVPN